MVTIAPMIRRANGHSPSIFFRINLVRFETPSFRKTLCKWILTVPSWTPSCRATALFDKPCETSRTTSASRLVSVPSLSQGWLSSTDCRLMTYSVKAFPHPVVAGERSESLQSYRRLCRDLRYHVCIATEQISSIANDQIASMLTLQYAASVATICHLT
jgi:hypothetical protein